MEEERSRLQEVIGKMEVRLSEQSRLLEQVSLSWCTGNLQSRATCDELSHSDLALANRSNPCSAILSSAQAGSGQGWFFLSLPLLCSALRWVPQHLLAKPPCGVLHHLYFFLPPVTQLCHITPVTLGWILLTKCHLTPLCDNPTCHS